MRENQIAEGEDLNDAVATNLDNLSPSKFLAPYTQNLDVTPVVIESLAHQF
jgi:cytochrome c oxidase subunit 2